MAFTAEDFQQLTQLLDERPEWRAELRRILLTDEILEMPRVLGVLAAAQQRTEDGLQRLGARVDSLAEAQKRTEARLEELAEAQKRTEARLEELAEAQKRTETRLETLTRDVGDLKGILLEVQHRDRPFQHFRSIVLKARTVPIEELSDATDYAVAKGRLTEGEAEEIELADAVVRGRDRKTRELVHLVVESSWGVGEDDVKRAARRAALLAGTGMATRPVAAGRWATPEAHSSADELDVWLVVNGHALAPGDRG
ncbi:MAG: hypothetical protein OXF55_04350 [Caldilineaceae bacterium]|nr:hypothetical protein [Caldilineaceae bacterium]MCY4116108.1 hypothetical protein [Caldilineaceae bacterium]